MGFLFLVLYPLLVLFLPVLPPHSLTLTLTHTHSLTHTHTHSLSPTHSHSLSHTHTPSSLTHTHSLSLTHTHSHTQTHTHSLSLTLTHSLTHSLPHSLTPSLPHSLTPSPPHPLTPSPPHSLTHSLTLSLAHSLTHSQSLTPPRLLRGRRGTMCTAKGSDVRPGVPRVPHLSFCVAWHKLTSTVVLRGRRDTDGAGWRAWTGLGARDAASLCVAGVPQPDIHLRFTWQAWHKFTSTAVLRGRRGTHDTGWRAWTGFGRP